jgi:pentatricopeptide repeat protein
VKAKVLMQMKEYDKALPYALKALQYNGTIADRTSIMETNEWVIDEIDPSNIMYINHGMGKPWGEYLTKETVEKFEDGDITVNDAQCYGDPLWDDYYGEMLSGVKGCKECQSFDLYWNNWGITSDRMYYVAAECYIRTGQIQKGLDLINKVREKRIEPDTYKPFTASTEQDAMALLQRAKFIECLATYDNFFDRKRWNTEADYKETLTRHITLKQSGKTMEFSIAPDSKLWIFPFPLNATRNNPNLTQNY